VSGTAYEYFIEFFLAIAHKLKNVGEKLT